MHKSKNIKPCLLTTIAAVALCGLLSGCGQLDIARLNQPRIFREFVCDPIPPSVREIKGTGYLSMSGDSLLIRFHIAPEEFESLLRQGPFQPLNKPSDINIARSHFSSALAECESPEFYVQSPIRNRRPPGLNMVYLMVSPDHGRCWFSYIHPGP